MERFIAWWRRLFEALPENKFAGDLPFEPEEMAALIRSGSPEDMRKLAAGLARPTGARGRSGHSE